MLASLCIVPVGVQSLQSANAQMQVDTAGLLQAEIDPDSAYGELVRMVQAGVEQSVVLAYINHSLRFVNLDADKIIYLTDLGAPSEIIEAVMERDRQLIDEGIPPGTPQSSEDEESGEEQPAEVTAEDLNDTLAPYGCGWISMDMAAAGGRRFSSIIQAGNPIATMVAGSTPITDGIGYPTIRGAGRRFTTAVGSIIRAMVGAGGRTPSGHRRGCVGGMSGITVDGRRCRPTRSIIPASGLYIAAVR